MNKVLNQVIEDYMYLYENEKEKRKILQKENQQLKKSIKLFTDDLANVTNRALQLEKQKDDIVEYIKSLRIYGLRNGKMLVTKILNKILRMLGEIDVED